LNRNQIAAAALVLVLLSAAYLQYFNGQTPEELRVLKILCAGSLLNPLNEVAESYMDVNPDIGVYIEGHGSIQVIRHHVEMDDSADLLMVADCSLIPSMMYSTPVGETNVNYTDWYIRFAGNELVLAYTEQSLYHEELNSSNWHEILMSPDVKIGFPNPLIDALGYRSLMIVQLAESYFNESRMFETVVSDNFETPFKTVDTGDRTVIFVPEIVEPLNDKVSFRASSIQLIPLLESGGVDYCFLYISNAKQYSLDYLELPEALNMGNPDYNQTYDDVMIRYQHARFSSIGLDRHGKSIHYGLTVPVNAADPELAEDFIKYILEGEGGDIFADLWHPIYTPSYTDNLESTPEAIRHLLVEDT
jgi:molybdate/tungstate transport system substrate-binding protein